MMSSPLTARAICLGMFSSIIVNLVMAYNDYYLYNSLLVGNHFPVISLVIVVLLVMAGNTAAKRWFGVDGLSSGEILLIWSMLGVAGGIGAAGIMRYFPSWVVAPTYYATAANEQDIYIMKFLPEWMLVSKDPDSNAVKWFMEGLPAGERIPWGEWVMPMATWFTFTLLMFGSNFALVSVFFQQWSVRERLIFPLVHLPLELSREAPKGKLLNEFLSNRLTWIGVAIPCLIWGINGLETYFPGVPQIPVAWPTWGFFADRPWNQFNMNWANLYFSVVGLTFLLTTEIAFSLWFFFFLYKLSFVYIAWLGSAAGFWGNWGGRVSTFETSGCMIAIAVFLFWTARKGLREWFLRALAGQRDEAQDPLSPRLALGLILAGLLGMIAWFLFAGASWWGSILGVLIFLVVILVLTRLIAEAGLMFVQSNVVAYDVLAGLFPPAWFSGFTLNSLMMQKAILMNDTREIFMPFVMNGLKACTLVRMHMGKVLGVLALTAVVALGISAYGRISTYYKYGGVNMDQWANVWSPHWFLEGVAKYQKDPPNYDYVKIGDKDVLPVNAAHMLVGGALTAGMLVMRAKFLWWPLHPFGLVMCGTWAMSVIWFSIFIGWAAKVSIMTFGGASVYRKTLPLFLGFVLGESLISAFWMLLGMITGTPGLHVLPN